MPPLEIDNPFWQFSLQVYASQGVPAECLDLQERFGIDVNVLLFAAWLGSSRGVMVDRAGFERISDAVTHWSGDVVKPLRAIRKRLKLKSEPAAPEVQMLGKRVAEVELLSEQIEQALLYHLADLFGPCSGRPDVAKARENVATLLQMHGSDGADLPLLDLFAACGEVAAAGARPH